MNGWSGEPRIHSFQLVIDTTPQTKKDQAINIQCHWLRLKLQTLKPAGEIKWSRFNAYFQSPHLIAPQICVTTFWL